MKTCPNCKCELHPQWILKQIWLKGTKPILICKECDTQILQKEIDKVEFGIGVATLSFAIGMVLPNYGIFSNGVLDFIASLFLSLLFLVPLMAVVSYFYIVNMLKAPNN